MVAWREVLLSQPAREMATPLGWDEQRVEEDIALTLRIAGTVYPG